MQVIGITAVTAKATTMSYLHLVNLSLKKYGQHPEVIIQSSSLHLYGKALQKSGEGSPDELIKLLISSLRKLKDAGASIAFIPNNSVHQVLKELEKKSSIKILSIVDGVLDICKKAHYLKVCILGPTAVIQSKLYETPLQINGIDSVTPKLEDQEFIQSVILAATNGNLVTEEEKNKIRKIVKDLRDKQRFDALIIACSELLQVYSKPEEGLPILDPFQLQSEKALEIASANVPPK